ncbi:hypothetical protein [Falsibacillus albus]|uniref:GerMN domain-containing protein n=1 Tax=Falsibacillus albus TaxID=2478915 RepID=A0A3L7JW24_9BACI|nr:hypothetical protein [Falsibacillus albus]RLQ95057.1 hypothetical protein D9X91_11180 [Falsibacillus albus]
MGKHDWDDWDIEELLQQMPQVSDHRKPEDIFRNIQSKKKKKKKKLFNPNFLSISAAIIAASMLFILLSPSFIKKSHHNEAIKESATQTNKSITEQSKSPDEKKTMYLVRESNQLMKTALYPEEAKKHLVLSYGLVTDEQILVPLNIITDKQGDWFSLYNNIRLKSFEKKIGLPEGASLSGDLQYDKGSKTITLKLSKKQQFSMAALHNLLRMIRISFQNQEVNRVIVLGNDGKKLSDPRLSGISPVKPTSLKSAYFDYISSGNKEFLVPASLDYGNIDDALEGMKKTNERRLKSVIPKNVNYKAVPKNNNTLKIIFDKPLNLNQGDPQTFGRMIEGMLLTANGFGYKSVLFENMKPVNWNGYDLSGSVETPFGPNKIILP